MENQAIPIEKRVFQIDRECYIVYLGSDREDYRPFLRIGNSKNIPKEIISNTYNNVITESLTGNPDLESINIDLEDLKNTRYIGEKNRVKKYLDFLSNLSIQTDSIAQYQELKDSSRRAVVYFYEDGNLQIHHDKELIFDLRRREQKDKHFLEKAKLIKSQLLNNPLRYKNSYFESPGFLLLENGVFIFERGSFIALGLPEDYFYKMAKLGIDPDLISSVITDKATEPLFDLLKRKRQKKERIVILTRNPSLMESAASLFTDARPESLKANTRDLTQKKPLTIGNFTIITEADTFIFSHKGIPYPLKISDKTPSDKENYLSMDYLQKKLTLPDKDGLKSFSIREGTPHIIKSSEPSAREVFETYFIEIIPFFMEFLNPGESILLKNMEKLFQDTLQGVNFINSFRNLKKKLTHFKIIPESPLNFLLSNAEGLLGYLWAKNLSGREITPHLLSLKGEINKILKRSTEEKVSIPIISDLYLFNGYSYRFHRLAKSSSTREDLSIALEVNKRISELWHMNKEFYERERERLIKFIQDLKIAPPVTVESIEETLEKKVPLPDKYEKKYERLTRPEPVKKVSRKIKKGILLSTGIGVIVLGLILTLFFTILNKGKIIKFPEYEREELEKERLKIKEGETLEKTGVEEEVISKEKSETAIGEKGLKPGESLENLEITILDVYRLTNRIAVENGHRELDSIDQIGKDPNWIYPGNLFILPDGKKYTVVKGDTIWYIAYTFIKNKLGQDWTYYQKIVEKINQMEYSKDNKENLIKELEELKRGSYSENFTKKIINRIDELKKIE